MENINTNDTAYQTYCKYFLSYYLSDFKAVMYIGIHEQVIEAKATQC